MVPNALVFANLYLQNTQILGYFLTRVIHVVYDA
jgi:hypothetical protein